MRLIAMVTAVLAATVTLADSMAQGRESANLQLIVGEAGLDEETGFVNIFGEVRNDTGGWIKSVRIDVDLLDADGRSLGVSSVATAVAEDLGQEDALDFVYSDRDFVPPGETAPFGYIRDAKKVGGRYASHRLSVSARPLAAAEAPKVVIENFSTEKRDDRYWASGVIRNVGQVGCHTPEAILCVYDAEGKPFTVQGEEPEEYFQKVLVPGRSVVFEAKIYTQKQQDDRIADIRAIADCSPID